MTLTAGTRLGSFEVLSPLGAGEMGEVYRARDTRLDRDVAIKVLPDSLASDPRALVRFQGEAVDFRSDQFSLGIVLYEMLAGSRPFKGTSAVDLLADIVRDEPEPLEKRVRRGRTARTAVRAALAVTAEFALVAAGRLPPHLGGGEELPSERVAGRVELRVHERTAGQDGHPRPADRR